jgi:hypothetical protein
MMQRHTVDRDKRSSASRRLATNQTVTEAIIVAFMDRNKSSAKATARGDANLLKHEQGHFDIDDYWAKQMSIEIAKLMAVGTSAADAKMKLLMMITKKFQELRAKAQAMQNLYDSETMYGTNAAKQTEWESKIAGLRGGN